MAGTNFQVFVEGAVATGPEALGQLAAAVAERYGLPAAELDRRLRAGRFRVKGAVDHATAEQFAADLERLGAVVSIVDGDSGAELRRTQVAPAPVPTPARAAPATRPAPVAERSGRESTSPARPSTPFVSGLSAAFGPPSAKDQPDLGALGGESGTFSLSALDGTDGAHEVPGSFAPADASLPASIGPSPLPASMGPAMHAAPPRATTPPPRASTPAPFDLFAPPEAEQEELGLEVAIERPRRGGSTMAPATANAAPAARPVEPPPTHTMAEPPQDPATQPAAAAGVSVGARLRALAGNRRARFGAGVVLTVLIGFVPAHLVASVRERSAFAEIDAGVKTRQAAVQDYDEWTELDAMRSAQLERKRADRQSIALGSLILWAAVSGAFGFVWFRKIDWDRLAAPGG